MSDFEPRIFTRNGLSLGRLTAKVEGEQYSGDPILDTRITLEGGVLCYTTWKDVDAFFNELNAIIEKYQI